MSQKDSRKHSRAALLKAVYDDNLSIEKTHRSKQRVSESAPPKKRSKTPRMVGLITTFILATFAFFAYTKQADTPTTIATANISTPPKLGIDKIPDNSVAGFDQPVSNASDYQSLIEHSDIALADVFGLGINTIVIDAGHGGKDPGTQGVSGLTEKEITLDIALQLKKRLSQYQNFNILLTRESDKRVSLKDRVKFANKNNADLFISIHVNYMPVEPLTIVETFYFGPHKNKKDLKLAQAENKDSGYPLATFSNLTTKMRDVVKQQESKELALTVQKHVYKSVSQHNNKARNIGIKTAPFVVLLGVKVPSILAEVSCINNREEEQRLATSEYRGEIAGALEQGIIEYLSNNRREQKAKEAQQHAKNGQLSG